MGQMFCFEFTDKESPTKDVVLVILNLQLSDTEPHIMLLFEYFNTIKAQIKAQVLVLFSFFVCFFSQSAIQALCFSGASCSSYSALTNQKH